MDKQRSTKHAYKTKDRVEHEHNDKTKQNNRTNNDLQNTTQKTSGPRRVNLVTNPMISHE